ncbi:MAG: response regulator, partial [Dysgonamonadaceae bacterium]|nr:response regulator [Dysgonamonadaceae bacterium]
MDKKTKYIFLLLFLLYSWNSYSQYVFRHLDFVDGMSDNQIRSLSMVPDGRLAVRTASILNLYDGANFEPFYQDRRKEYQWNYAKPPREYYDNKGRIWMKENGYLLLLNLNTNQFIYDINSELQSFGIDKKLKDLFIDESKNYWFITEDNTFSLYDVSKKKLEIITEGTALFTEEYGIPCELAQYKNLYWIVYTSGLIRCWDVDSGKFISQDTRFLSMISEATDRIYIHPAGNGDIWLMYNFAVCFYSRTDRTWKEVATISGHSNFFTCMDLDRDGNGWVGTSRSGLRRINGNTFQVETIPYLQIDRDGISNNDIHTVFVDNNNGLWVGTLFQGLYYYHPSMRKFTMIQTVKSETSTTNEIVRCFLEDKDGTVLVGTANGIYRYFPDTHKTEKVYDNVIKGLCLTLYRDSKDRIWAGTYLNGFFCFDGSKIKNYNRTLKNLDIHPNQNVSRAIYEDAAGRYWVSAKNDGIGELNLQTGEINMLNQKFPQLKSHRIEYNFYPVDKNSFITYGEKGICYYNTATDSIWIPEIDDWMNAKFQDRNTKYYCIFKDSRSLEWFGTELGIRIWDDKTQKHYTINVEKGLPNNSVSAIQEDNSGIMWVSSVNGITRIEVKETADGYEFALLNFNTPDGLQSGKFYDRSSLKAGDGSLYFGGIHGFNVFDPQNIVYNSSKNKPVFTSLKLFNSPVKENTIYKGRILLERPVNRTEKINLNYNENFITVDFAGLNFVNPSRTYFKYKLENFDKNWNEIVTEGTGSVTYTGLQPGTYKLIVYTANNDYIWGDEPAYMTFIISPPFWATIYAFVFYALLIIGAGFGVFLYFSRRNKKRLLKQKEEERRKQKEDLDQMKFRFFTNISHEFRTPLTLIMTPLQTLIQQQKEESLKQKLASIYRNAENMLSLINQLLDFRKLEMGGEKLKLVLDDFIRFAEYVHASFKDLSGNKSVTFTLESETKQLFIRFDKDKMRKIISNLYSNALKFTPAKGYVSTIIRLVEEGEREFVKIEIADTGCGIEEKEQQSIFERFYQSGNAGSDKVGSGIGLHLVKEYVELHEGKITINSKVKEGSTFTVFIPTDLHGNLPADAQPDTLKDNADNKPNETNAPDKEKTLLIVEDNSELRHFLAEQLSDKFNVLEAEDGAQGEEIALKKFPDLIVSDLMMPKIDGLELCHHLKNDIQTSHIPIILLTARLSDEAKIESYKVGADSYIAKPFSF